MVFMYGKSLNNFAEALFFLTAAAASINRRNIIIVRFHIKMQLLFLIAEAKQYIRNIFYRIDLHSRIELFTRYFGRFKIIRVNISVRNEYAGHIKIRTFYS